MYVISVCMNMLCAHRCKDQKRVSGALELELEVLGCETDGEGRDRNPPELAGCPKLASSGLGEDKLPCKMYVIKRCLTPTLKGFPTQMCTYIYANMYIHTDPNISKGRGTTAKWQGTCLEHIGV